MPKIRLLLTAAVFAFLCCVPASVSRAGQGPRKITPLSDSLRTTRKTPAAAARAAFRQFAAKHGKGWKVRYSPRTALPEAITGGSTSRYPGSPEQSAAAFFAENRDLLGVDPAGLRLVFSKEFMGVTHLQYQQYKDGLPVEFAYARVHVSAAGEILGYQGKFEPGAAPVSVPAVSVQAAVTAAIADLGVPLRVSKTELVFFPDEESGALKLAWKIQGRGRGLWVYYVDAASGAVLLKYDDLRRFCDGVYHPTLGTSSATVYEISPVPSGDSNVPSSSWVQPVTVSLPDQYVWVGDYSKHVTTTQHGDYCSDDSGKVFSSFKGPYFSVTNFRGPSAHWDNGTGVWRSMSTLVQTPHPYADFQVYPYPITIPADKWTASEAFAKVMPRFSSFNAGQLALDGTITDGDEVYVKNPALPGATEVGAYIGSRSAPFFGASVESPLYSVELRSDVSGTNTGFVVDISSFLVLTNNPGVTEVDQNKDSVVWSTSNPGVQLDRSLGDIPALSEGNAFYHMNAAHNYFGLVNRDPNHITTPPADLSRRVAVMVHAHGDADNIAADGGMGNAYYDLEHDNIMLGDGPMDANHNYHNFALDGTILRHEYVHLVMHRIYPIINFGEFGAISEGLADYFSLASFWKEGKTSQVTLGNFLGSGEGSARDISGGGHPTLPKSMPGAWVGEVHDDGLIFSQALYALRLGSRPMGNLTDGRPAADVIAYAALFYFPDNFLNFRDAMLDACRQFESAGCNSAMRTNINAAFSDHGITGETGDSYETATPPNPLCENNNGPECAVDISNFSSLSATIYPEGDLDYYSLPVAAGNLTVRMDLPQTANPDNYYAYSLFLFDANRQIVLNPDGSQVIASPSIDYQDLSTLSPSVTLSYNVPKAARYYLVVSGALNETGGNSAVNSLSPYHLTLSRTPTGSAQAQIFNPSFDNDDISFSVPCNLSSMVSAPSSATLTAAEQVFEYAQLRDHEYQPLPLARTNLPLSLLRPVLGTFSDNTHCPITGRVKLWPGFAAHYPGAGTVYLEVLGRNHLGSIISLGVSNPINLSADKADVTAYNNIIGAAGARAIIKYELLSSGTLTIKVYTQSGALVKTVYDGPVPAGKGTVDWDGTNSSGGKAASGIYFVKTKGPGVNKIVKIGVVR